MRTEFKFKDSIYLIIGGHEMDLHDAYYFRGVNYSIEERRVTLTWERSDGNWVGKTLPPIVEIEFIGTTHFQFNPRDPEMPFSEDDCLSSIGYWANEEWRDGVFTTEIGPDPTWLTAFEFMSGAMILIKADKVQVVINR